MYLKTKRKLFFFENYLFCLFYLTFHVSVCSQSTLKLVWLLQISQTKVLYYCDSVMVHMLLSTSQYQSLFFFFWDSIQTFLFNSILCKKSVVCWTPVYRDDHWECTKDCATCNRIKLTDKYDVWGRCNNDSQRSFVVTIMSLLFTTIFTFIWWKWDKAILWGIRYTNNFSLKCFF